MGHSISRIRPLTNETESERVVKLQDHDQKEAGIQTSRWPVYEIGMLPDLRQGSLALGCSTAGGKGGCYS